MLSAVLLLSSVGVVAQGPVVSPQVAADRSVTFRLRDIGASKVELNLEGSAPLPMSKDASGLWTVTTGVLAPDIYGYTFSVDGQTRLDPSNPQFKPNLIWQGNMFIVPGTPPQSWEVQHVPHGTIHHHFYQSKTIGDERDYLVYTPAGFKTSQKLPVLYLLHGYSDTAIGWTEVGKANVILDNLIAEKQARPMVVVMTLGYGVPNFASPNGTGFDRASVVKRNYDDFRTSLLTEVLPAVQKEYGTATDAKHRAIAGLSMGGAESLYVGLNNTDKFGYVAAFSSGGMKGTFEQNFPEFDANVANKRLSNLYITCGTSDGLIDFNRQMVKWLKDKGTKVDARETPGEHSWMVWRRNLETLASMLFK